MMEIPSGEPKPTAAPPPMVDIPFRALGAIIAFRAITEWTATEGLVTGELAETRFIFALIWGITALGWILAPFFSSRPVWYILTTVRTQGPAQLVAGAFGLLIGVSAGAIIAATLPPFEEGLGRWLPAVVTLGCGALGAWVMGGSPAAGALLWKGVERSFRRVAGRPILTKRATPAVARPTIERPTDQAA